MDKKSRPKRRRCEDKSQPPKNSVTSDDTWIVTADQLRELWCYDNECGRKFMKGCPLRTCSVDGKQTGGDCKDGLGLTVQEMVLVKLKLLEMWKQAGTLFEIFINKEEVEEGYRLRVRKDAPVKLAIKQQDALVFGWIAQIPTELSTAHVFNRSTVEPRGYLGGPISYMNWCSSNQQKVCIFPTLNNRSICKMYITGALPAGSELKWNYGRSFMPSNGVWFHTECCEQSAVDPVDQKRHGQNVISRAHCFKELCVLCGFPYSIDNKENRAQRKQHLAGVHADFLGSEWNGTGFYDQQEVDPDILFCAVDILNQFLGALKRMNWNVLPACNIFSPEELEGFGADEEALFDEFQRRKENFKVGGTLILRGSEIPSTAAHFQKIEPRQWKVLTWKNNVKPPAGRYAVSTEMKEANQFQLSSLINSFFEKYM